MTETLKVLKKAKYFSWLLLDLEIKSKYRKYNIGLTTLSNNSG
jgi:hypothetical protein